MQQMSSFITFIDPHNGKTCDLKTQSNYYTENKVNALTASDIFKGNFDRETAENRANELSLNAFFLHFDPAEQDLVFWCRIKDISEKCVNVRIPLHKILAHFYLSQFA